MAYSKKEREHYNKYREHTSKELGITKNQYNALRRIGEGLRKAGEHSANTGDYKHYGAEVKKHFTKAEAIRKKVGGKKKLHFHHQTDPRGAALYAAKNRINKDRYNTEGRVIY